MSVMNILRFRRLLMSVLIGCLLGGCLLGYTLQAIANPSTSTFGEADLSGVEQVIPTRDPYDTGISLPTWNQITFANLPRLVDSGSVSFPASVVQKLGYDPSREWVSGDSVASFIFMGDLQHALEPQSFSLRAIADVASNRRANTGFVFRDLSSFSLAEFGLAQHQQLSHLATVVPGLGETPLKEMPPIWAAVVQEIAGTGLLNSHGIGIINDGGTGSASTGALGEQTLNDVLQQYDHILSSVDLGVLGDLLDDFSVEAIPGLDEIGLEQFQNWEQATIDTIPNLDGVPMSDMPNPIAEVPDALFARIDVPLDPQERSRLRSLSGSYQSGFAVDCASECMHAELSSLGGGGGPYGGEGGNVTGMQWIGGQQLVEGGFGALQSVNGGQEPTGRNPYGSVFKQVIWKVDPAAGNVQTALYFRFCYRGVPDLGCTPYFLGPIPFLVYSEKQPIFLGIATPSDPGTGLDLPTQVSGVKGTDIRTGATGPVPPIQPCPEDMDPSQCVMLNPLPSMSGAGVYSRFRRRRPGHDGNDMQTVSGSKGCEGTVVAPDDGVVIHAGGGYSGYAYTVVVYHPHRQIATMMAHLCRVDVQKGQHVSRGQTVGVEGGSGGAPPHHQGAYYTHLHFEVHAGANQTHGLDGVQVDPENYQFTSPERTPIQDLFG